MAESLLLKVRDLIGVPFVQNGRDPKTGLDCYGLFKEVQKRIGIDVPEFEMTVYDALSINMIAVSQEQTGNWKKLEIPKPGCLVAMCIDAKLPNVLQHIAVYLEGNKILHTIDNHNVSVFRTDHLFFKNKIMGYYEWAP
jgi:cell wall-associated NlpC family hydrolase